MGQILILISDTNIGNMLEEILCLEKYDIRRAGSLEETQRKLIHDPPEIILTDQTYENPLESITAKNAARTTVIVLESHENPDCHGYRTRRLGVREAVIKINAHFKYGEKRGISSGDILLDIPCSEIIVGNMAIYLTRTELIIMKILILADYRNVPIGVLIESIRQHGSKCTELSLRQHISNLRRKLRGVGSTSEIAAVQGIGYTLICRGQKKTVYTQK